MRENRSLNLLKGISCLIVVLFHCPLPGVVGEAIVYGLRFPVPVFFMISGYYSYGKDGSWLVCRMKKMLRLILGAELFAGLLRLGLGCFAWNGFFAWLNQFQGFHTPLRTLFFGSFFNGTLWYLYAMFWAYAVLFATQRFLKNLNFLYVLSPVLIICQIAGRYLVCVYGDMEKNSYLFGGAILFGLPFMMAGRFVAEHEKKLVCYFTGKRCLRMLFAGLFLMLAEYVMFHTYMDLHVSTVVIAAALFLWCCGNRESDSLPWLRRLGRDDSMWIYLLHFPIVLSCNFVQENCVSEPFQTAFSWVKPAVAVGICMVLARCVRWGKGMAAR